MDYPSTLTDYMPTESSEQKTTAYNNLIGAASGALLYGRNDLASLGLSWAYFGGNILVAGVLTAVADGAVTLTDDDTNYVEATTAGVVSANVVAFTAGRRQLYTVVVADGAPTEWVDYRTAAGVPAGAAAVTQNVNDASTQIATDEFVHLVVHGRSTFSNAAHVMTATERFLAQVGTMSAQRQVTLPAANAVPPGTPVQVYDESGTLTSTNKIVVVPAGSDTLNSAVSKSITSPYGRRTFVSDGTSKWTCNRDSVAAGAATFTAASVLFADAAGAMTEDNANFYYDDTANLLYITTAAPGTDTTAAASTAFVTAADVVVLAAAEAYADALVVGLWDDRGNYNASGNVFPSTGGSGTAGAILKGDIWTVSVAGTLGGHAVTAGDTVRALVDTPGSTDANWAIGENNIGYVPLNAASNLSDLANAGTARTNLGGTTVGQAVFTLTNPSAITFIRLNADNSATARSASDFKSDLGVGTDITNKTECLIIAASDETTALTAGTAKVTFRMPYAFTLTALPRASLKTAQASGGIFTVDINEGGTSILSTKLTIDNTERTSTTAATPAVLSDTALADDAEMTVDIDSLGDGTAIGLKIILIGHQ